MKQFIRVFDSLSLQDIPLVGGKNASLGEMLRALKSKQVQVPDGFALTVEAYRHFIEANQLEASIHQELQRYQNQEQSLNECGRRIRHRILNAEFPTDLRETIQQAYQDLSEIYGVLAADVAVRSSATAEDLPDASFAGQQESYLNVIGSGSVLESIRKCYASLFTDRAIAYREKQGYAHMDVFLSVGIQKMARSDLGASGVLFTLDTETGFPDVVVITGAWGLGECVVQGMITPDEFIVFKPLLSEPQTNPIISKKVGSKDRKMLYSPDRVGMTTIVETSREERHAFCLQETDILKLARWAVEIEKHYQRPMDIEWAYDGQSQELFIVQARPETVQSQKSAETLKTYRLKNKSNVLLEGLAVGDSIATGNVCLIKDVEDIAQFKEGSILVTTMTDPDWVPIMSKAAGIITDQGGRTCHAAIVSRELGVPALVGTNMGTRVLKHGQAVTLSCAEGDQGFVYAGFLDFETEAQSLTSIPQTQTQLMLNIANPDIAFRWWRLPAAGIGLARMEFIINNVIRIHPMALLHLDQLDDDTRHQILELTRSYPDKERYFVDQLAYGIAKIAASQHPHPVIVRMSDFKSNEYANLIGGSFFEADEENPMIGFRGASRYYSPEYQEAFKLECQAIRKVREEMGLKNVTVMIPFCRTLAEAEKVQTIMAKEGLHRGKDGLEIYVMCELPANVFLASQFAKVFDGFSIGSNDLTQLTLGVDRDSSKLTHLFDERNEAIKCAIIQVIAAAKAAQIKVGICGQGPSDFPDFAEFLVEQGIDSMSLNPDSFAQVAQTVATLESASPF